MSSISWLKYLILITLFVSSCEPAHSTITPVPSETKPATLPTIQPTSTITPTQTAITPTSSPTKLLTSTNTPHPTQTATSTPLPTLEPEQANEVIKTFLQNAADCESPCLLGIFPGKTTLSEAKDIFTHLGLQIKSGTYEGKDFYGIHYGRDSNISILGNLLVQAGIVKNITLFITPEDPKAVSRREWLAFSPETLINRYGQPSRISFAIDFGLIGFLDMTMYFDEDDLIVEYYGNDPIPRQRGSPVVCPLTDRMETVRIWMGKDPFEAPEEVVLLEKATSMTMEEFSELMTGNPGKACFKINEEVFQ